MKQFAKNWGQLIGVAVLVVIHFYTQAFDNGRVVESIEQLEEGFCEQKIEYLKHQEKVDAWTQAVRENTYQILRLNDKIEDMREVP